MVTPHIGIDGCIFFVSAASVRVHFAIAFIFFHGMDIIL